MRRVLTILFTLGVCAAAVIFAGASTDKRDGKTYQVEFDNAFGLVEGGDFQVGGVTAGTSSDIRVVKREGEAPKAVVTVEVTERGFDDFRTDATCDIKPQSLIGEYFVDCQPGSAPEKLPAGGTVPVEQTTSTIPADLVNNIMRRPYRERFRLIVTTLGTGLAGRPDDLAEALRRAHPGLRETSRVLRILGDQNQVIKDFIADSDRVVEELEGNKRDVVRWVEEAGDTAEITATRRAELQRTFQKLPTFLDELRPTMARLGELADEQTPLLADMQRAAPSLNTFFTRLGPFAEASTPAVDSLGETSKVATRTFREGKQEIKLLRRLAPQAQPTFKPLRQFLQTIDDRRRGLEDDPRSVKGSPPAPDPTAIREGGPSAFTGMEALWNYFFWQSLSINGFDQYSHMLRISITESKCGQLYNEFDLSNPKDRETFDDCSQWLGPNLPGITTPDFTEGATTAGASREAAARQVGERRSAGQPDAGALPGQPDISRPQIALPPDLQRLVERLTPRQIRNLRPELRRRIEEIVGPLPDVPLPRPQPGPAPAPVPTPSLPAPAPAPAPGGAAPQGAAPPLLDYLLSP
jgi:phospholipid/cholesterol/gamma-HCH transport system substrate-binding protein